MNFIRKIDNNFPILILITVLFFSLGASLAYYLGSEIHSIEIIIGILWALSLLIAAKTFAFIRSINTINSLDSINIYEEDHHKYQIFLLVMIFAGLVFLTALILSKMQQFFLWGLFLLSYAVLFLLPVLFKKNTAIYPVLISIFQGSLVPAISYNLFSSGIHRSLTLMVFPLTLISIAVNIALEFSTFARDEMVDRKTIIRSIGWKRGILLHHFLLLISILFLLLFVGKGLPSKFDLPIILTSPLVLFDIIWLQRIKAGYRPVWPFFNALSLSIICIIVYLFTFTLWIN